MQDTDQTDNSNQHSIVFMEREVLAKAHRKKKSGKKVDNRKKGQKDAKLNQDAAAAAKRNPRAFIFSSKGKAKIQKARTAEREQRRMHVPVVEQLTDEPAPYVVLLHGPPGVGKSTLIRCLVKHYTKQDVKDIKGPVTVVAGKQRRLMFVEAPQDMTAMIGQFPSNVPWAGRFQPRRYVGESSDRCRPDRHSRCPTRSISKNEMN